MIFNYFKYIPNIRLFFFLVFGSNITYHRFEELLLTNGSFRSIEDGICYLATWTGGKTSTSELCPQPSSPPHPLRWVGGYGGACGLSPPRGEARCSSSCDTAAEPPNLS